MNTAQLSTYPAVGEVFELTLEPVRALDMVKADGYDPTGWEYRGREVTERQTGKFKLVSVGYQPNFKSLCKALKKYGAIQGQWREALKARYRQDGLGPVGVADDSWVNPNRSANFPCVHTVGLSHFHWSGLDYYFGEDWRWLVPAESK